CLAPFGLSSCNLYLLNVGNDGVLNINPQTISSMHSSSLIRSQYGILSPNSVPCGWQVGAVLEHAAPVLIFHFYSSTPSIIEKSSIPHPAISASAHSAMLHPHGRPSSLISIAGIRRAIPSAASPSNL